MPMAKWLLPLMIGIVLVLVAATVPIFGMPFGGCGRWEHLGLNPGCSAWPELVRGLSLMVGVALIAGKRTWVVVGVATLFAILALGGGVEIVKIGYALGSSGYVPPDLIGVVTGLVLYLIVRRRWRRKFEVAGSGNAGRAT